jgi:hypothetical protein
MAPLAGDSGETITVGYVVEEGIPVDAVLKGMVAILHHY